MTLQHLSTHQQTVLTEIRKNEAILLSKEFMTLQDLEELWEKQHKLTIVKPGNGQMKPT